jgi:RNA polymerase sigma factor (sigma-70 family)
MEEAELIKEAKKGSAAAQKILFDQLSDNMMIICCRYLKTRQDAEEVLLDGFLRFFQNIHQFSYRGKAALHGYLKSIMINQCLMALRKKNNLNLTGEWDDSEVVLQEDELDQLSAEEILLLIMKLPVGYRTVFNLFAIEGLSHEEISGLLGITVGTSKSQLSKARGLLQKYLQKGGIYANRNAK